MSTIDLYSTKDIKECRDYLLTEQQGLCAITGLPIEKGQAILEHAHDSEMFVRGVASRQANSALGVIERVWIRYLKWWYPESLPYFLRKVADYIEKHSTNPDIRYRHNSFQKKLKTMFNALSASQQNKVLELLGSETGSNPQKRKELFSKLVLTRNLGYEIIRNVINQVKEG